MVVTSIRSEETTCWTCWMSILSGICTRYVSASYGWCIWWHQEIVIRSCKCHRANNIVNNVIYDSLGQSLRLQVSDGERRRVQLLLGLIEVWNRCVPPETPYNLCEAYESDKSEIRVSYLMCAYFRASRILYYWQVEYVARVSHMISYNCCGSSLYNISTSSAF